MSNHSKNQRKHLLRTREHNAHVASELQRERRVGEDLSWRGIGERVLQIREISSFMRGFVWDVRRAAEELKLYVSELNPEKPGYLNPGYRQLDVDPQRLDCLLSALASTKMNSWLPASGNIGLDGTTTFVEFRSGFASVAVSWWEEGPPEWNELIQLVKQVVQEFKLLSNPSAKGTPCGEPPSAPHVES
jgi:hypothetical protein